MDILSLSPGIIAAVTHQLFKIQIAFASKNEKARAVVEDAIGDLHVYVHILNEINSSMFSFQATMPPASRSCLELCFNRASRIANLMSKGEQKVGHYAKKQDHACRFRVCYAAIPASCLTLKRRHYGVWFLEPFLPFGSDLFGGLVVP
jgi:hypothetical protein